MLEPKHEISLPLEETSFQSKDITRSELILGTIKQLAMEGYPETALEHAALTVRTIKESSSSGRSALFEIAVIALRIAIQVEDKDLDLRNSLHLHIRNFLSKQNQQEDHPSPLFPAAHAVLALDFATRKSGAKYLAFAGQRITQAYQAGVAQMNQPAIGEETVSDLIHLAAQETFQLLMLKAKEEAWGLFQRGHTSDACQKIHQALYTTALTKDLDIVQMESIECQRQLLHLLEIFFLHQSGDWKSLSRFDESYADSFRDSNVRMAAKLMLTSAHDLANSSKPRKVSDAIALDLEEFIVSAPPEVLALTISAMHTWSISLVRNRRFESACIVLNAVLEGLEWDNIKGKYPEYAHNLTTTALEARARAHYFEGFYQKAEEDLIAILNLVDQKHHLRAPVSFARAFINHCAALRQYWLTTTKTSEGALGEFYRLYDSVKGELPLLDSGDIIGGKPHPWARYTKRAAADYAAAIRKSNKNPLLNGAARQNLQELRALRPPGKKTPFF